LTSATHLQRGLDAVIAKTAAPSGGKYLARPTLSGKSSPDFLSLLVKHFLLSESPGEA
jgi:hypothetical protein